MLSWALTSPASATNIRSFIIQRSVDHAHFTEIAALPAAQDSILYRYIDPAANMEGDIYYRLVWQHTQGDLSYSHIIAVNRRQAPAFFFSLQPNPVNDHPLLTVTSEKEENALVTIFNAQGRSLLSIRVFLHKGANAVPLPLQTLASGGYFLAIDLAGRRQVKPFIRKGQL